MGTNVWYGGDESTVPLHARGDTSEDVVQALIEKIREDFDNPTQVIIEVTWNDDCFSGSAFVSP